MSGHAGKRARKPNTRYQNDFELETDRNETSVECVSRPTRTCRPRRLRRRLPVEQSTHDDNVDDQPENVASAAYIYSDGENNPPNVPVLPDLTLNCQAMSEKAGRRGRKPNAQYQDYELETARAEDPLALPPFSNRGERLRRRLSRHQKAHNDGQLQENTVGTSTKQPIALRPVNDDVPSFDVGKRLKECTFCHALKWTGEEKRYSMCCSKGRLSGLLQHFDPPPEPLRTLLVNEPASGSSLPPRIKNFRNRARYYNNAFSMASSGITAANPKTGISMLAIKGNAHHFIGPLNPTAGEQPKFAQLYVLDDPVDERMRASSIHGTSLLDREIIESLNGMFQRENKLARQFRQFKDVPPQEMELYEVIIKADGQMDKRRYNIPRTREVAGFMPGGENESTSGIRDIRIRGRATADNPGIIQIDDRHPLYDPLRFPLLHPRGERGWSFDLNLNGKKVKGDIGFSAGETDGSVNGRCVILPSSFVGGPRYMQQAYQDAMAIVREFGKPDLFITQTCNPQWPEITRELKPGQEPNDRPDLINRVFRLKLNELLDDIMKKEIFGRPVANLFVVEFQKRGLPHAHILIILDIDSKPLTSEEVDRFVCAELPDPSTHPRLYSIVTKHMLHGPCGAANPTCPCMVDNKCSKNFPKQFQESTVITTDGFPAYRRRENGATYVHPKSGFCFDNRWVVPYNPYLSLKYNCHINVEICNSVKSIKYIYKYVYKGHDRAEVQVIPASGGPAAGGQHAAGGGNNANSSHQKSRDEIAEYIDGRYVSASEAAWRLHGFELQQKSHTVERLPIHLENMHQVFYQEGENLRDVAQVGRKTKLLAWFQFNKEAASEYQAALALDINAEKPAALSTKYHDVVKIATWDERNTQWKLRQNRKQALPVGRMYSVHPSHGERFYLRMLLTIVPGATSYEDLRASGEGGSRKVHETFKEACQARGLLDDDSEVARTLEAAANSDYPSAIREIFVQLLLYNMISNPAKIWDDFKDSMSEDFLHQAQRNNRTFDDLPYHQALRDIDARLKESGRPNGNAEFQLPEPDSLPVTDIILEELSKYDRNVQKEARDKNLPLLNEDQRTAYNAIMETIRSPEQAKENVFFLDGPGGSGKTMLYNLLLSSVKAQGKLAFAVASSGIAALLLEGGRTAHSTFKIPVKGLDANSTCYVNISEPLANLIRESAIVVWDEAPMMHKWVYEAVDRMFRDVIKVDKPFGGKTFVLGGDYRQVLPVLHRGRKADIIAASLNKSRRIWQHVRILKLRKNMRVQRLLNEGGSDAEAKAAKAQLFSDWLLRIGEGKEQADSNLQLGQDWVRIPPDMCIAGDTLKDLISDVYGELGMQSDFLGLANYVTSRAILTPLNCDVDSINNLINCNVDLSLPGKPPAQRKTYYIADSVVEPGQEHLYPSEFLNKLDFSGMPPHVLHLQEGCPIILLRNMSSGLANGTRLIVVKLQDKLIEAQVATGPAKGRTVFIPRLRITPSDAENWPFTLARLQFPVRAAFAMTINKSQGQTLEKVGLYLRKPVFCHGQLYVALSRTGSSEGVRVLIEGGQRDHEGAFFTRNVVFPDVLLP